MSRCGCGYDEERKMRVRRDGLNGDPFAGLTIAGGCDGQAERDIMGPEIAQVGDAIHYVNDPQDPCWAAIVTARTSSPFAVMAAVLPPGAIPGTTSEPIAFEADRPRSGTWHLQDCCPIEADDPRRWVNAFNAPEDLIDLIPVQRSVRAIRWSGTNLEAVRDFCGDRAGAESAPAFLLPGEITGSWRNAHVWHAGRKTWEPVKEGTWIVRDVTGHLEALDLETLRAKYLQYLP